MPILLWPFPSGIIPPPARTTTGKVFIIDAVPSMDKPLYVLGANPRVGEACALVFNVGPGPPLTQAPVLFTFTRPDGGMQVGDTRFAFIGSPTVTETLIPSFASGQYLVYIFAAGELSESGVWKVSAMTTNFFSNTYSFTVTN